MGAGSVPAEAVGRAVYAIPRAELWKKTANFQTKSEVRGRVTCVFTWRILLFVFLHGLLAVPPEDMNFEDAPPFLFRRCFSSKEAKAYVRESCEFGG